MRYRADITAGALKVAESRIIADLLLRGVDRQQWQEALLTRNGLQVRHLNRTTRHWHTRCPELKLQAQPTKGTEVP